MPNPFDELADVNQQATAQTTTTATGNAFDELDQENAARRLRVVTSAGLVGDPARAARIIAQQQRTQLPADLIDRNLDDIEKQTRRQGFNADEFRKTSPMVSAWLAKSPYNVQVAQDDLPNLAELEQAMRYGGNVTVDKAGQIRETIGNGSMATVHASPAALLNTLRQRNDVMSEDERDVKARFDRLGGSQILAGMVSSIASSQRMVGASRDETTNDAERLASAAAEIDPSVWGEIKRGAGGLLADMPLMLSGGPLASGAGSLLRLARARAVLAPYLTTTGAKIAAGAVQTVAANAPLAIREGITTGQEHGAINGAIAGLIESVVPAAFGHTGIERALIGGVAKDAGRGWLAASGRLLKDAGWEAGDEMATELAHAIHEQASGMDPNAMDLSRLTRRMFVAGVLGGAMGAGFNLPGVVADKLHRDGMAAADSITMRDRLQKLGTLAQGSKLAKTSPEAFAQVTQELSGDGTTYFQADDWQATMNAAGVDPVAMAQELTGDPNAYALARATGGTISIPTGKLVAKLGGATYFQTLADQARPSPGGMSAIEAQTWAKEAPGQAQKMASDIKQAMGQVHGDEHAQRVYDDVRGQLINAGRPSAAADQEALLLSAMHKTFAERYNKDPNAPGAAKPINAWTSYQTSGGKPGVTIKQDTTVRIGEKGYDRTALADVLEASIGDVLDVSGKPMAWAQDQQGNALTSAGYKKTFNAAPWFTASKLRQKSVMSVVEALRAGEPIDWSRNQATREIAHQVDKILAQHVERFGDAKPAKAITAEEEAAKIAALDEEGVMFQALIPRNESLAFGDLLKQWRKANGDRTPVRGSQEWQRLEEEARKIDAENGRTYYQAEQRKEGVVRGSINFPRPGEDAPSVITLFETRNNSTFIHETGHYFLEHLLNAAEGRFGTDSMRSDAAAVMKWLGIEDRAGIKKEHHERFARGFEQYIMEGKAPSASLMGAFTTFKRWLVAIYKTARNLNADISPEIRRTFDRMLATDEEIAAAEHARGGEALWETAAQAGMDASAWQAYQESVARTTQDARDRMERELIQQDLAQQSKERAEERIRIRDEIAASMEEDPAQRLISALQDGTAPDGTPMEDSVRGMKLDRAELVQRYGQEAVDKQLPGPKSAKNKGRDVAADKGGISLEAAAAIFGYDSGDAVWHALVDAPDRRQAIEKATDAEMDRIYPDPLSDPNLGMQAEIAMHGELRQQLLAREIDALSRQVPGASMPAPIELLRAAAKEQVKRTRALDLNPQGFYLAERRAAKAARDAIINNDRITALAEKQRELLNHELYMISKEAAEEVDIARKYLATFSRPATRQRVGKAGGWEWTVVDPATGKDTKVASEEEARRLAAQIPGSTWERTNGYLDQIDAILDGIDFATMSRKGIRKRLMLSTWIAEQQALGLEPAIAPELITGASMSNWRTLSAEELLGIKDSIVSIEHLANLKNELMADAKKRTIAEAADSIASTVFKSSGGKVITRPQALRGAEIPLDAIARFAGAHRRLTDIARVMDGHQDGGPVFDHLVRPLNEASDREATMQSKAIAHMSDLWRKLGKPWTGTSVDFRRAVPRASERVGDLSHEERLSVALNWGNASNRQRILTGHQWEESDVLAILDTLDKADWDFVQGVLDHVNSYWSETKALQQRITGVAPPKIEAVPIFTKFGKYKGGYYPAKYDSTQTASASQHSVEGMFNEGNAQRPTTRHGHTNERDLAIEAGMKLRLDLGVMREHVSEVVHDITHRETLMDADRILTSKEVRKSIEAHYGVEKWGAIRDTLIDVARGDQAPRHALNKLATWMRSGGSISAFAYNFTSALSQITGIAQSTERLGLKWMFTGIKRALSSPLEIGDQIRAKSEFMANRARTFNRDIRELGSLNMQEKAKFYLMMQKMQEAVDIPTWMGAYEKAVSEGHDDKMAVSIADQTLVDTQGGGRIHDLAPIMRGSPLAKLFTQFASFPNVAANLVANSAMRNGVMSARFAGSAATLVMFQAVSTWLLKSLMKGDWPDDGEELAKRLAKENASFALAMVIGGRELSGPIFDGRAWTGPAGTRGIEALGRLAIQSEQGEFDRQLARSVVDSLGVWLHLPSVFTWRIIDGLIAPGDRGASPRAALFGRPPREKK